MVFHHPLIPPIRTVTTKRKSVMTIEEYLRGKVGFEITDEALRSILVDRNIAEQVNVDTLTTKDKELAYADILMWGATRPSSYTGSKDSDGGWSHTEASSTLLKSDKERFESIANNIYIQYNDPKRRKARIKIINLNGICR